MISIDTEKAFDRMQYLFTKNDFTMLVIDRKFSFMINGI